jgi:hypothetical protein
MYVNSVHGYTHPGGGREDIMMREIIGEVTLIDHFNLHSNRDAAIKMSY